VIPDPTRIAALLPFHVTGPMGRSTADAHLLLRAQVGGDKRDAFSTLPRAAIPNPAPTWGGYALPYRQI
jgi:hypothetical protein